MTATRDRRRDHDSAQAAAPWGDRPLFGTSKGLPWWGAVLLAVGLAILGAVIDMSLSGTLGRLFQACYFVGCVAAICVVRRRTLFGPMVEPPLILGIIVPVVVLLGTPNVGSGLKAKLLVIAAPLLNGFPTMALTTVITLGIGLVRIYRLQRDPNKRAGATKPGANKSRTTGARRGAGAQAQRGRTPDTTRSTSGSGTGKAPRPAQQTGRQEPTRRSSDQQVRGAPPGQTRQARSPHPARSTPPTERRRKPPER